MKNVNLQNIKLVVSPAEFKTIHEVIYSVVDGIGISPTSRTSRFRFNYIASQILAEYHNLKSRIQCGFGALKLDDEFMTFIGSEHHCCCHQDIYCWLEIEDFVLDFFSPLYSSIVAPIPSNQNFPIKMFQKPVSSMSDHYLYFKNKGDFYFAPDFGSFWHTHEEFFNDEINPSIYSLCLEWYNEILENGNTQIEIENKEKEVRVINLHNSQINGEW